MNISDFLFLRHELSLMAVFVILFIYDVAVGERGKRYFHAVACTLLGLHTALGFVPAEAGAAFGGMYVTTDISALMKNILSLGAFVVFLQAEGWLRTAARGKQGEFYVVLLSTLLGMYFMASAGSFMLLYLGIETASLPMACLAAFDKGKDKSAEAGAKYILLAALSSGIMLFGMSLLYGATGSMYFADMGRAIAGLQGASLLVLGFVFFFVGLAFKISIVPFHLWAADVYEGAPTSVTAYLSVVSKGAAVFALVFALWQVFGAMSAVWHHLLWGLSVLTIVLGNLFAIGQKDIKRFFAFSSISQAGFILLGVMGGTAEGMAATTFFVLVYLFSNLAAFGVISAVENASGRTDIAAYNGLYRSNPKLAFVMMLAVFSLAGIPPFAGFFSKFFIFAAAAEQGEYLLVFIALVNTVVSLFYYLLMVKAMFINPAEEGAVAGIRSGGYSRLSLALCTAGILLAGLLSGIYEYIGASSFGM
ncbi:MAG: NADH-quinone oxidoreductase subunit N [Prevotellaceae bacterium]|jgi:NADH-quinone oxidoreductase subunit N|nr:NADH-quinone oxidoreductase subunit N [Prevotellaceae bacterium]